jgi:glycosyltransferase involved in cell wall biosynthesis
MISPRISVIMPAYNHEGFIEEAIASVLAQSIGDFELLIHDDGSTDNTLSLAQKAAENDARITVSTGANMGLAGVLNKMVRDAKGEFLAICAADDVLHRDRLAWGLADLDAHPEVSVAFTDITCIDQDGKPYTGNQGLSHPPLEPKELVGRMLLGNCLSLSTAMGRRDAILAEGMIPTDLLQAPDYALWMSLLTSSSLYVRPGMGAKHRVHDHNLGNADPHRAIAETIRCIETFAELIINHHKQQQDTFGALHGRIAKLSFAVGDHERSAKHLSTKIKHNGLDETESLLFLQCLMHLRHDLADKEYAETLASERNDMAPDHQALFDQLSQTISQEYRAD